MIALLWSSGDQAVFEHISMVFASTRDYLGRHKIWRSGLIGLKAIQNGLL